MYYDVQMDEQGYDGLDVCNRLSFSMRLCMLQVAASHGFFVGFEHFSTEGKLHTGFAHIYSHI
jgi:hypothetical protein